VPELIAGIAADPGRHISVPGMLNLRDVGGYPAAGGGHTGWRRLLRSDGLSRIDESVIDMLAGFGLKTVIDLRTPGEADIAPSPVDDLAEHGILSVHISLLGPELTGLPDTLTGIYDHFVDRCGQRIATAIRAAAQPGALPALVHCTAGKDRTGVVIAFALAALGVPDRVVAADYALSSLYLDPQRTPVLVQIGADTNLREELTAALMASPPELIVRALDRARRRAGTVASYLAEYGVTALDLANLRAALVEDGEPAAEVRTFD
jgi:protein-tyrosine phosphatase